MKIAEMLSSLEAPVYIERVALGSPKQVMAASRAVRRALECQVRGLGFALVEILSPCPTIWKLKPLEAQQRVREEMAQAFPPGVYRDRIKDAPVRPAAKPAPPVEEIARILDIDEGEAAPSNGDRRLAFDARIRVAGFGGQGVLLLGEILAEAGLGEGLEVSWLPSYGPEMRSGTSNCHVRLSKEPVASPLVSRPNVLVALNEPSLRKFVAAVEPGGWVLYNGTEVPEDCRRADVTTLALPVSEMADHLGEARAANVVMLGALVEATGLLPAERVDGALERLVKSPRWLELDRRALARGRESVHAHLHP
jgi:2-oxoisovalerate ferredoxin oxidoreductase beta subunit